MNRLLISLVALVALVNVGCSVEGSPGGGDDAVGAIQSNLTGTIASGTYSVVASVMASCATSPPSPGGCDGQAPVVAATTAADSTILFPELNLGPYVLSVPGAPIGTLLPACSSTDAACIAAATMPYCIYTGTRTDLVGCSYTGHTPNPIPVLAGTTNTATLNWTFHFSDGDERTLYTSGDLVVTLAITEETVCGVSTDPCGVNELCARISTTSPPPPPTPIPNDELACYPVCYVPAPLSVVTTGGPWGTLTIPCPYPNSCVHVAGLGFTGMFNFGLCVPPAPPAP